jgi:hypothetical protein
MGKKQANYTAKLKLKVILYAEENGTRAVALQLNMDPKCICTWCSKKKRNRPFKGPTQQYGKCISTAKHPLTPTWRLRQAALFEVYQWIFQAWIAYYIRFDIRVMRISNAWS